MRMRDIVSAVVLVVLALVAGGVWQRVLTDPTPAVATAEDVSAATADDVLVQRALTPTAVSACNSRALGGTLENMPNLGTRWVWANTPDPVAGWAFAGQNLVVLDPGHDCGWTPVVALHEWFHIATYQAYGEMPSGSIGGEKVSELIADCGAKLLAERFGYPIYTNYADRVGGCDDNINVMVMHILETV